MNIIQCEIIKSQDISDREFKRYLDFLADAIDKEYPNSTVELYQAASVPKFWSNFLDDEDLFALHKITVDILNEGKFYEN